MPHLQTPCKLPPSWGNGIVFILAFLKQPQSHGSKSKLAKHNLDKFQHFHVSKIPLCYDGNVVYEFPPFTSDGDNTSKGALEGMGSDQDCCLWTKSNFCIIKQEGNIGVVVKIRNMGCMGVLKCTYD
jgi:hypothetical protein